MDVWVPCPCPGTPHADGDTVTLSEPLSFRQATAMRKYLGYVEQHDDEKVLDAELTAALSEAYVLLGIEAWTFTNGDSKPIPLSPDAIRHHLLDAHPLQAMMVATEAETLYREAVLLPLQARASMSSRPRLTNGSTYQSYGSTQKPPKRSKRSLTTTTRTEDTATMPESPDGGSNS